MDRGRRFGKERLTIVCMVAALGLALSVLGMIGPPRRRVVPVFSDLPPYLLPGSPLPAGAQVSKLSPLSYAVRHNGHLVRLTYDPRARIIVNVVMGAGQFTVGDLILAWGTPSGFARYGRGVDVYWGVRYAYLNTCSFQPDSRVELIVYYLDSPAASPWRGFTSSQGCE